MRIMIMMIPFAALCLLVPFVVTCVVFALFAGLLVARRDYGWNSMHFFRSPPSAGPRSHDLRATEGNSVEKHFLSFLCQGSEPQAGEINMVRLCLQSLRTTTTKKADQFWLVGAQFEQFVKFTLLTVPIYLPHSNKTESLISRLCKTKGTGKHFKLKFGSHINSWRFSSYNSTQSKSCPVLVI